jgi:hypothetical protein
MTDGPVISRFLSADSHSAPEETLSAPIINDDPDGYDFHAVLKTYAEHQTLAGYRNQFSFSAWDGGHDKDHHEGTSCVTLEYKEASAQKVRDMLPELGFACYEIETRNGRSDTVLFAFPVAEWLDHEDTTRAASLIAAMLETTGLKKHSFLYTYFFRFRTNAAITFHEGALFSRKVIAAANEAKIYVELKTWLR